MKSFLFFLLLPALLFSQELQRRTQALMGTFVHITLPAHHNRHITQSFNLIRKIEHSLSSYDNKALVYRLNHSHQVPYDGYLADAIEKSKQYYHDTDGYFDITIGSISKKLYRFGEVNSTIPSQKSLDDALLNIHGITVNKAHIGTQDNITLDLGGVGKGLGVDHVASYLQEQNITQGIIALSGDIRCLDRCTFGIQSPFKDAPFAMFHAKIPQLSISTSGIYRRYVETQAHHHLIDPKRARQGKAFISVSLFTKADNTKIDAYATAISVMPKEKAFAFLDKHKEIGYILMTQDKKVHYGNLEGLVTLEWLEKSDNATNANTNTNKSTNTAIKSNLNQPPCTHPNAMKK